MADLKHWLVQLFIAVDQLLNVLITPGQRGAWADETLSSRAWRMEQKGKIAGRVLRPLIDKIMFLERDHCRRAFLAERARLQLPPEARF